MSLTAFKVFITVTYTGPDAPASHKTIRRFSAKQGTTLAEFRKLLIDEILRRPEASVELKVSYKDADGDVVEVASELEWAEALQQHSGAVSAGTAIPILVDVKMDAPTGPHTPNIIPVLAQPTPQPIAEQPVDVMSQFSPIDPSEDEYNQSDLFDRSTNSPSDALRPTANIQPQAEEEEASEFPLPTVENEKPESPTQSAEEDQRQPQTEEDALALPQPSTDALMMQDEASPSSPAILAPNGWEEVNAENETSFEGEEIEMTSVTNPSELSIHTSDATAQSEESRNSQSQASQSQQGPQPQTPPQQPRPTYGFFANPFAALLSTVHQQLAAQPRANNRYPRWQGPLRGTNEAAGNPINNGVGFAATVARYQKRTGATKAEDTVRLLALCPNATAQQAQEALEKYNGQVYRAANYLLDITSAVAAPQNE